MIQIKVGLMDATGTVEPDVMVAAAAALNVQVTRDLPQFWNVSASVAYLPNGNEKVPQGVWPVQLVATLPPDEGRFHQTNNNQPYAKVIVTPGSNEWTIDASHETLEMLVDPSGSKLQTSTAIAVVDGKIKETDGQFEYLVEACDPCEAVSYAYQIGETFVSDFLTPHFYEPNALPGTRYSFTGAIIAPRQILPGGYISWIDPQSDEIQQLFFLDPNKPPKIRNLGSVRRGTSLRAFVDSKTRHFIHSTKRPSKAGQDKIRQAYLRATNAAAIVRAKHYK